MLGNLRDAPFYKEDVIKHMMGRDKTAFVDKFYSEKDYDDIVEHLVDMFSDKDSIPDDDMYHIIKQFLELFYYLHYEDEYKHYKSELFYKGTSPSKKIDRDIQKIVNYEKLLKQIYKEHISAYGEGYGVRRTAPNELIQQFDFIENLKSKLKTDGTYENKKYYKPTEPTKSEIKEFLESIEEHYDIELKTTTELLKQIKKPH